MIDGFGHTPLKRDEAHAASDTGPASDTSAARSKVFMGTSFGESIGPRAARGNLLDPERGVC